MRFYAEERSPARCPSPVRCPNAVRCPSATVRTTRNRALLVMGSWQ